MSRIELNRSFIKAQRELGRPADALKPLMFIAEQDMKGCYENVLKASGKKRRQLRHAMLLYRAPFDHYWPPKKPGPPMLNNALTKIRIGCYVCYVFSPLGQFVLCLHPLRFWWGIYICICTTVSRSMLCGIWARAH
jgi:hypothetical protein